MNEIIKNYNSERIVIASVAQPSLREYLVQSDLASSLDLGIPLKDDSLQAFPRRYLPLIQSSRKFPLAQAEHGDRRCPLTHEFEYPDVTELTEQVVNKTQSLIDNHCLVMYRGNDVDFTSIGIGPPWIEWINKEITPRLRRISVVVPAGEYAHTNRVIYRNARAPDPLSPNFNQDLVEFAWSKPPAE